MDQLDYSDWIKICNFHFGEGKGKHTAL